MRNEKMSLTDEEDTSLDDVQKKNSFISWLKFLCTSVYLPLFETLISFPLTLYLLVGSDPTISTLAVTCSNLVFYGELSRIFWTKILFKRGKYFCT
jgi:hypothetical protein